MKNLTVNGGRPVRESRLPIARPIIESEELESVRKVLESGVISRGPKISLLEKELSEYIGCRYAVAVSSGTAALHLALESLDLAPGSEVIVPSITFVATAFAPLYCGLKPVFAEVSPDTLNIDPQDIRNKITGETRAIIPVHYGGQPADMDEINEIARENNLVVIEDAAHAIGAVYKKKKAGSLGDLAAFSFFATKNVTSAEGGIVTTDRQDLYNKMKLLRAHCIKPLESTPRTSGYYDVVGLGYNYHLSDVHAALALTQLKKLDELNQRRKENAKYLTTLLNDIPQIEVPTLKNDHVFHLYTIKLKIDDLTVSRDDVVEAMLAEGIHVGVYYRPIHLFSYFKEKYGFREGCLPVTESISSRLITLPMYPQLTTEDMDDIAEAFKKVLSVYSKG